MKLTGEIADCVMIDWDKKLKRLLEELEICPLLYSRFKDDIALALERIMKGSKLVDGKLVIDDQKQKEDENKTDEKVTMEIIQEIANGIDPMIKVTIDTPCNYDDRQLPILDVKVRVNQEVENRIDFEFFEKPTKNPKVILADSALSSSSKRTILTQECLRRLRNTKLELGKEIQNKYLSEFMLKLKNSGYSEKYRKEILNSANKAYQKIIEDDKSNKKPMYRCRNWKKEERNEAKFIKKRNWWNRNPLINYKSVLFVPPTPGGALAKEMRKREEELNKLNKERIKIVEKGGIQMKQILTSKNPFQKEKCKEKWCPLCNESKNVECEPKPNSKLLCRTNNVGYRWVCLTCKSRNLDKIYEGESSRSARIRGAEHVYLFITQML